MNQADWYKCSFNEDHLIIYQHRSPAVKKTEAEFALKKLDLRPGAHLLDLCCGDGGHLHTFKQHRVSVVGFDLSRILLEACSHRFDRVCGDMRRIPFKNASFDGVTNFFTSFGYFIEEKQNRDTLKEICRVLKPASPFLLDYFNGHYLKTHLEGTTEKIIQNKKIVEKRTINSQTRRVEKAIELTDLNNTSWRSEYSESIRLYEPDELLELLGEQGFEIQETAGSFSGEPFTRDSKRFILIARKKNELR